MVSIKKKVVNDCEKGMKFWKIYIGKCKKVGKHWVGITSSVDIIIDLVHQNLKFKIKAT